jgi:homoserine/homoserine lactone efflux protein
MTPETILIFALSIALLYIKPGSNQAMKITRTLNNGFLPAWFFTLGATSTVMLYFCVAGLGAGLIQTYLDSASIYFKIFGGGYLVYLGYRGLSNIDTGAWSGNVDQTKKESFFENYGLGVIMTLANPITIFYFVGIVPTFMTFGALSVQDIIVGLCVIAFVGNMADIILIALVAQTKQALSNTNFVRGINIFASLGFIAIGAFFLYSAFFIDSFSFTL